MLRLRKALYGLKQSPLCWFNALSQCLRALGFLCCPAESALFFRDSPSPSGPCCCWVVVYVDDLLMACSDESILAVVFTWINQQFILKRIEPVESYLGIQQVRDVPSQCLFVHQQRYIDQATALVGKGAAVTPLTYALRLDPDDTTPALSSANHLRMVGQVAYASFCTRPDLAFPHSWLAGGG